VGHLSFFGNNFQDGLTPSASIILIPKVANFYSTVPLKCFFFLLPAAKKSFDMTGFSIIKCDVANMSQENLQCGS
jgi:hypothetical protein